tara:strand:+ start:265 stop:1383 length:1119 start_codon:yes stop_codon:yes gene_type:complete
MQLSGTITFTSKTSTAKIILNGFTGIGDEGIYWVFDLSSVTRTGTTPSNNEEFYSNFSVGGAAGSSGSSGTSGASGSSGTSGSSGSSGSSGTSGSATIANLGNNRVTTSTGVQGALNAESNLTFDGSTLTVTGDLTATGNTILGQVGTDTIQLQGKIDGDIISEATGNTIGDATNPWEIIANTVKAILTTGVDNSVVIKDADGFLKTDEIDSRVWGSSLVDATTGAATRIAIFTDANSIEGESRVTWDGNEFLIDGVLTANEKNFDIPHPSKEGWRLRYSVMEGAERGVYVRGKITDESTIQLPDYWKDLVYEDSISVQLTAIGKSRAHHVVDVNTSTITVGCTFGSINAYYHVYAERKADAPLTVEYETKE